jgi:ATP-binding cassette subfamily F protein 3
MIALNLDRIQFTYISQPLFTGLSWEIHEGRVVGLIGPNGCGKSTLLRIILGELTADAGFIMRKKGLTVGYLEQEPVLPAGSNVITAVMQAHSELQRIEDELERVENRLADPAVYGDEKALTRTLDQQEKLLTAYQDLGGPGFDGQVRAILRSLGFADADFNLPVEVLSGGQVKLVGLARLLVNQPELLLLDEPDNHLDLDSKTFLEQFIRNYPGAVVIVSHDRYLLDLIVDEIAELEDGQLTSYEGNYSEFVFEKQARLMRQQQLFQAQKKEITRLEQSAKRLLTWGKVYDNEKFSKRGMNILRRLEKMEKVDQPVLERKRMDLELSGWQGSQKVLELLELEKVFAEQDERLGQKVLFQNITFTIRHSERVGLVGPNGAGKSYLFKSVLGTEAPTSGEILIGPSVKIAYYAQHHETLDFERSLLDTVRFAGNFSENRAVAFLKKFLFPYEQVRERVGNLSGGERSRLQLALLMLSGANLLLLDEPTNHLDIASAEVLEDALEEFRGTVFVISHDRYFLDRVATRILAFEGDTGLFSYEGNWSDYETNRRKRQQKVAAVTDRSHR